MITLNDPPDDLKGRAVITTTDRKFSAGAYVLGKMIEHFSPGTQFRVYSRLSDPVHPVVGEVAELYPIPGGGDGHRWTDRTASMLDSGLRLVFHLDADCYPVGDISQCFTDALSHGEVVWQDIDLGDPFNPLIYGLSPATVGSTFTPQCGAMVLDARKHWRVIQMVNWYCARGDYYFRFNPSYDQPQWRAAWAQEGIHPFRYSENRVDKLYGGAVFLHQGCDGTTPLIVHRTGCKFDGPTNTRLDLPGESLAWEYYDEFRRLSS